MKLHRDLEVTQETVGHLVHRLREGRKNRDVAFSGPAEVYDELRWQRAKQAQLTKLHMGRGPVGTKAIIGMKDRETNQITALRINRTDELTLYCFVGDGNEPGAQVYSNDHPGYRKLPNHEAVKHSVGEYVDGQTHTNGIESFWPLLERGYDGVYHKMSREHLDRYVTEFTGRQSLRCENAVEQLCRVCLGSACDIRT